MSRSRGYPLPSVIGDYDTECVKIMVPKEVHFRRAFWGQLHGLTNWWTHEHGQIAGDRRATEAAKIWRSLILSAQNAYASGETCDMVAVVGVSFDCETNILTVAYDDESIDIIDMTCIAGADGADGREIELRSVSDGTVCGGVGGTRVEWRYVGETSWLPLATVCDGADGADCECGLISGDGETNLDNLCAAAEYVTETLKGMFDDIAADIAAAKAKADVFLSMVEVFFPVGGTVFRAAFEISYGIFIGGNLAQIIADADILFWRAVKCALYCVMVERGTNILTEGDLSDWQSAILGQSEGGTARPAVVALIPAGAVASWNGFSQIGALETSALCAGECDCCTLEVHAPSGDDRSPTQYVKNMGGGWWEVGSGDTANSSGLFTWRVRRVGGGCFRILDAQPVGTAPDYYNATACDGSSLNQDPPPANFDQWNGYCVDDVRGGHDTLQNSFKIQISCDCVEV